MRYRRIIGCFLLILVLCLCSCNSEPEPSVEEDPLAGIPEEELPMAIRNPEAMLSAVR